MTFLNRVSILRYGALSAGLAAVALAVCVPVIFANTFSTSGFMPHGHCYLWTPSLMALHFISDTLIGLSYTAISLTLAYLVYRARDTIPFGWVFLAFGTFIIACGATHFMEVWTLWQPAYWLAGDIKLLTALASVATAVVLPPLVPRVLALVEAERLAEERRLKLDERTALLKEAEAARMQAEQANRTKDQFLAVISHELRTPLSPILAWSRMLRSRTIDERKREQAIESIERNARAQAQLIDDLLDVSRIVSGKLRLDIRAVDLRSVIDSAVDSLRPAADAKQVHLETRFDSGAEHASGDPQRLQQVVWNLISNAIKFTPRGGRVDVHLKRSNSDVEIAVSDTGQGLAPEFFPHLFERFWQADNTTTRPYGGLGLGLAIVRHLVELHGGTVSAQSEGVGRGSTFSVRLPVRAVLAADAVSMPLRQPSEERPAHQFAHLEGVRALVVDDDPDSNAVVQTLLASCGAEVRVAGSTAQALDILNRWHPDVLVSDIGMPDEDGFRLIQHVRARVDGAAVIPAIALTAYARGEDRAKILAAGYQMHVTKPVDPVELTAAVASLAHWR
jgi:signal transduction histidine kinase/ActR/RegA family two-component response regulator